MRFIFLLFLCSFSGQVVNRQASQNWHWKDYAADSVHGISLNKAYKLLATLPQKASPVIVAVIDGGIDTNHVALKNLLWTNAKEIPNNNMDDDKNGYIDDIHGWNFLGTAHYEQLEYVRLLASGNTSHPRFYEAKAELDKEYQKALGSKSRTEQIIQQVNAADKAIANHLNKNVYTRDEVNVIKTENQELIKTVTSLSRGTNSELSLILKLLKSGVNSKTIFHDLIIKKGNGKFSQADIVLATTQGIVVIEVKDYGGWIFGNGNQTNWTQIMAYGKNKYRFYKLLSLLTSPSYCSFQKRHLLSHL